MNRAYLLLLVIINLLHFSCQEKVPALDIVQLEYTLFEVAGDGKALNFPVFSQTIATDEIIRSIDKAEYYYKKLSNVYDFKEFTVHESALWKGILDTQGNINDGAPVFNSTSKAHDFEIVFSEYANSTGVLILRIEKGRNLPSSAVRHQRIELQNGHSVSIGAMYDQASNRGFLIVLELGSFTVTPETNQQDISTFLSESGGDYQFKPSDQQRLDDYFGSRKYTVPVQAVTEKEYKFVEYDKPPFPLTQIKPEYPQPARESGLEGTVLITLYINENGIGEQFGIKKSAQKLLDNAALAAVKNVEWKPALVEGKPIGVWITVPVKFRLDKEPKGSTKK